jgi:acetate---CoA ligase (ADP-forming)
MYKLFNPNYIAVIGASNKKGKIGNTIVENLLSYGKNKIFPINPNEKEILGLKAYSKINDLSIIPDLVIIAIPKQFVKKELIECGKKGIKYAIIISAGYKETGDIKSEKELINIGKKYNIRILGPNVLGLLDNYSKLDCIFLPKDEERRPKKGQISIISQSGTIGATIVDNMPENKIGLSKFISYGNASDINESDLIEFLEKDKNTKVIVAYVEEIIDGERFFKVAKKTKKPIIILKAGLSETGSKSVQSHTGSLAGDKNIYEGIFKQLGITQIHGVKEFLEYAKIYHLGQIKDCTIITNGGGYGILLTDQLENNNLKLRKLKESTKKELKQILPEGASINNPIDLMGDAGAERYIKTIEKIKKEIDCLILIVLGQTPKIDDKAVDKLIDYLKNKSKIKKIVVLATYQKHIKEFRKHFLTYEFPKTLAESLELIKKN